ncbi:MAG: hypothetical protein ABGX28_02805 [Methylococcales bacterium]
MSRPLRLEFAGAHNRQTVLRLTPMGFLDRVAVLIPPPLSWRISTQCAAA